MFFAGPGPPRIQGPALGGVFVSAVGCGELCLLGMLVVMVHRLRCSSSLWSNSGSA